jgi:hypothetical protein
MFNTVLTSAKFSCNGKYNILTTTVTGLHSAVIFSRVRWLSQHQTEGCESLMTLLFVLVIWLPEKGMFGQFEVHCYVSIHDQGKGISEMRVGN